MRAAQLKLCCVYNSDLRVYASRVCFVPSHLRIIYVIICSRVWSDDTAIPGVPLCLGAEIVHGDNSLITRLAAKHGWSLTPCFTWAQGDGGPSDTEAPDGGAGYYWVGASKRCVSGVLMKQVLGAETSCV